MKRLLAVLVVLLVADIASAQPNLSYSFLRDGAGRPSFGIGLRPVVTPEMGIPPGTPFFDRSTNALYYWDGSAWMGAGGLTSTGNTLELRNGTSAQAFQVYGSYVDSSNYQRGFIDMAVNANFLTIGTVSAGSGTAAGLSIRVNGTNTLIIPSTRAYLAPASGDAMTSGDSSFPWSQLYATRAIQGSKSKALTDAGAAVSFMVVAVPTNGHVAGELGWTATSVSGADQLVANGRVRFWGTDTAGTPVCGINKIGTDGEGHSGGGNTLVCTLTNAVSATNCAVQVTCTNDLAAVQAITFYGRADTQINATLTFP